MKTLMVFLCVTNAAFAQQRTRQEDPPRRPGGGFKPKPAAAPELTVQAGTEIAYDDNILELNEKQIKELEDGTKPQKYRIDQAEDVVYSAFAEVRLKTRPFGDRLTAALKFQPYFYNDSSIANYETYELSVTQALGKHAAGFEYDLEYDVYLRELEIVVPGPNQWDSAFYDEHDLEFFYRHQFSGGFSVRPFAGWRIKDFDSPFGFRDLEGFFIGFQPTLEIGKTWTFFFKYEYSAMESEAAFAEPDVSHNQHEFELGAAVSLLAQRLQLSIRQRFTMREYTTSNLPADDPSHVDREDERLRTVLAAKGRLGTKWAVELVYIHRQVNSDRPFDTALTTSSPGDASRNVISLGVTYEF